MNVKRNIPLAFIIGSLVWGRFYIPVLALFYIASQVPLEQFSIIMAAFALITLVLEIPSGVFADIVGKKTTLIISRSCYVIEIFVLAFYNSFWPFLIAKLISGVGVSLSSGTNSALIYDSLKKLKRTKDHKRISGSLATVTNISMGVVFIIGAYLFSLHHKLPAYASLPLALLAVILTFFLVEPYPSKKKLTLDQSWKHFTQGFTYIKKHDYVKYLIFFSLPLAAVMDMVLSFSSVYFEQIFIPISLMGVLAFVGAMITAYSAKKAYIIEERWGEKKSFRITQLLVFIGILGMAFMIPYYGVLLFFLIPLAVGFFGVLVNHYMNTHIETSHRATTLSIKNFANNLGIFILFPIIGYMTKLYSMRTAFLLMTFILLIYWFFFSFYVKSLKIKKLHRH